MPLSIKVNLRVTGHCNQGGRKYMEDMFSVAYQQTSDDKDLEYAFFGIFDGHGGGEAATFAKEHLMDIIVKQRNFWSDKDEDVLRAIRDGYVNTHYAMWRELEKWPRTASGLPSTAGTTASVAFIRKGKIYIGHVGDSGIILGYQDEGDPQWKAKALTKDHKPESVPEMMRIQESGGKVVSKSGVPRVVWNRPRIGHKGPVRRSTHIDEIPFLAVARSLGDLWSYNSELDTFVVSPEPDVKVVTVDLKSHRCLIFGTDGLWNMLTPQAAVAIVQAAERHNEKHLIASQQTGNGPTDIQMWINPSKSLVDRALERWSSTRLRADNTSVVTLMLDPPGPSRSEVLMSRKNERVTSPKSVVPPPPPPSACPLSPSPPTEDVFAPIVWPSKSVLPSADETPSPKNPDTPEPPAPEAPAIPSTKVDPAVADEETKAPEKNPEDEVVASTSRECIQVAEISSSDACVETDGTKIAAENNETVPASAELPANEEPARETEETETPNVDSSSKMSREITPDLTSLLVDAPSPLKYLQPEPPKPEKTSAENPSNLIRQNAFCGSYEEFKSRPRLRRAVGAFGSVPPLERAANSQDTPPATPDLASVPRRRQSQGGSLVSHLESRTARRRQSVNATTTTTTTTCLVERQKSYFTAVGPRTKREVSYLGISREHRTIETINSRSNENPAKGGNRTAAATTAATTTTTSVGTKRRHSSTSEPAEEPSCVSQEPIAKRRTRSEDRPGPIDENDPANQEKQQQQHSRLRWPEETGAASRQRSASNSRSCCSSGSGGGATSAGSGNNAQEKLPSPNSFQRRSLEKKATPVKTIRRPSINGSSRIQLRGSFALRDWDQSKSGHRDRARLNRTVSGGGVIGSTDASPAPNLQRWLRSDTLAATPVKTLRSRNVDITGHTVPAQIAHQYGVVKQNRLSLPAKLKIAGKMSKLSSSSTTSAAAAAASSLPTGKLQKPSPGSNGAGATPTGTGSSGSGITRRVKSPYNPSARSALGTRSRLKRLGK